VGESVRIGFTRFFVFCPTEEISALHPAQKPDARVRRVNSCEEEYIVEPLFILVTINRYVVFYLWFRRAALRFNFNFPVVERVVMRKRGVAYVATVLIVVLESDFT